MRIFRNLKSAQRKLLMTNIQTVDYQAGQTIFEENEPSYGFYSIISGEVETHRGEINGENSLIGTLAYDDVFGLGGLVFSRHNATAIAKTNCAILRIPNNPVHLVKDLEEFDAGMIVMINMLHILAEYIKRLLENPKPLPEGKSIMPGYEFDENSAIEIIEDNLPTGFFSKWLSKGTLDIGETLFKQGQACSGFYFIHTGCIEVLYKESGNSIDNKILTLDAPYVIGQIAFFTKKKYGSTIKAKEPVSYTKFSGKDFNKLRAENAEEAFNLVFAAVQLSSYVVLKNQ